MEASPIKKIGGEYAPPRHQRYREQPEARWAKAQRRRKYLFTDEIDQLIREIYLSHPGAKTRPGIRMLAKKVGIPHWVLKKRARELGLARTKELPWSDPELDILARYAWMSDERIRLRLKAAGYSRNRNSPQVEANEVQARSQLLFRQWPRASAGN